MAPSMWAIVAIALTTSWQTAETSASSSVLGMIREVYTTNAICRKKNCVNPVFPGMEDLHRLQQATWVTSSLQKTSSSMGFCKNAITYDPALPVPDGGGASVHHLVQRQDNAASTMFYYHLAGLGLEAWDYQKPEFENDCIKSVWRMVCFTYFPRAEVGSKDGAVSKYIRPCQSSCMNYVRACNVECCDESVQCVFTHKKVISKSQTVTTEGYLPHDGPSSLCTGGARRSAAPLGAVFWALLLAKTLFSVDGASVRSLFAGLPVRKFIWVSSLVIIGLSLQGSAFDVPIHTVANWRAEPDYLIKNQYTPPGLPEKVSNLNSCSYPNLNRAVQCSGRGDCKRWDPINLNNPLMFCQCDRDWADPECRTHRKSQLKAYFLSIFAGFLGADQFYLGFYVTGALKLFSFGGFGIWWIYDIVRIGSAPVSTKHVYSTAQDLPHFAYVISIVMLALTLGFVIAHRQTLIHRLNKRKHEMSQTYLFEARDPSSEPVMPWTEAYKLIRDDGERPNLPHEGFPDFDKEFPHPYVGWDKEDGQGGSTPETMPLLSGQQRTGF